MPSLNAREASQPAPNDLGRLVAYAETTAATPGEAAAKINGLIGQALHGYRLAFCHPKSGEQMVFYAPLPDYFMTAIKKAGEAEDQAAVLLRLQSLEA